MKKFVEFLATRDAMNITIGFGYGVCCTGWAILAALWLLHAFSN